MLTNLIRYLSLQSHWKSVEKAKVAQLVEHDLAKVGVAGSNPVFRSFFILGRYTLLNFRFNNLYQKNRLYESQCPGGGTGRHAGLKILWPMRPCGFKSRPGYLFKG